jgi:putative endonuclease
MCWFFYIVECRDGSLYCGVTKDIKRRIEEHNKGLGGRYTRTRMPVQMRYFEKYPSRGEASKRECQIKGWTRKKKLSLVQNDSERSSKLSN